MKAYTSANCIFVKNLHSEYLLHLVGEQHLIIFLVFGISLISIYILYFLHIYCPQTHLTLSEHACGRCRTRLDVDDHLPGRGKGGRGETGGWRERQRRGGRGETGGWRER